MFSRVLGFSVVFAAISYSPIASAVPNPSALNALPAEGLAGQQVCFDATISNTGDPGFSPYLRIIADSELQIDSATAFGNAVSITTVGNFSNDPADAPFELEDPFTETMVSGQQAQSFSLVRKQVGSVVENGPELATNICVTIDAGAAIGTPLNLSISPVFQFGDTATGANGPVEGSAVNAQITPTLYEYTFKASSPEQERVPNESVIFEHNFDVANGSTITEAAVEQVLNSAYTASASPTIIGGVGCTVNSEPSTSAAGGTLDVSCDSVTGTNATDDLKVTFPATIGDVLDLGSCAVVPLLSEAEANADFPVGNALAAANRNSNIDVKHLTLQQSISSGSVVPGDTRTVTNSIKISEFVTPSALVVVDTLSDGFMYNNALSVSIGGVSQSLTPTFSTNAGQEIVTFDLSSLYTNPTISAAKTVEISYSVLVEETFVSGDDVLANDGLSISTQATYDLQGGASACTDDSGSGATVLPVSIAKSIVGAVSGMTPMFEPGQNIVFRLRVNVPSGDINNFTVTDFLPLAVIDVSTLDATFGNDVRFSPNNTLSQSPTSLSLDAATNSVAIEFTNLSGVSATVIEFDIEANITTDPFADPLKLTNIMQLTTTNSDSDGTTLLSPVSFDARAPILEGTLTQTLPAIKDGNDEVNFRLELENTGGADAYDIKVLAPAAVGLDGATLDSVVIQNSDGSVAVANPTTSGSFAGGDFNIDGPVEPGQVVVVLYDRLISDDVTPAVTITSTSETTWAGAPTTSPFPKIESELEFDIDDFSLSTAIESVSPGGGSGSNIVVGDTVTYRTSVVMPESEVDDFTLSFTLPAGLDYVASSAASDATGFGGTIPGTISETVTGDVATGLTLTLELTGTLVTTSDNNNANNTFGISFDALVADEIANDAKENTQTKSLATSASFDGRDGSNSAAATSTNFAEHDLSVSTTTVNADGETSGFEDGDVVTISVSVENIGTAPAYDVGLSSIVNADLFDLTTVTALTTPPGFTYSFTSPTVSYTGAGTTINEGDSVTFVYQATVRNDVRSGSNFNIDNTATGSSQSGTPTVERSGTSEEDVLISTEAPSIGNLQVIDTSESWTGNSSSDIFAIGEVVTYQFETSIPEGITAADSGAGYNFEVQLPTGYEYIAASSAIRAIFDTGVESATLGNLSTSDAAITPTLSGNNLRFNLGDITNDDDDANEESIVVTFDMLVKNLRNNNRNNSKKVNANLVYQDTANRTQTRQTSAVSRIGEPRLRLDFRARASTINGGATVFYDTTLRNLNGTYNTRAWDFELTQTIPDDLTPQSVVSAVLSRGNLDISACVALAGQVYTLDTSCLAAGEEYLDKNERITLRIATTVDADIQFDQRATGRAEFTATSLPGENGTAGATVGVAGGDNGERTGSRVANGSGQSVNDLYLVRTATVTAESPTVDMVLNEERLQIGETLTISADVAVPTGSTENFELTLTLPSGLAYEGETIRITEPSSGFTASATPNVNPANGLSTITLNFGDIANAEAQPQELNIEFDVSVSNIIANQNGVVLSPSVSLDYSSRGANVPSASEKLIIIEPNLELSQTIIAGATGSDAGDTIRYRTTITNTSGQGTAYNVNFQDVLAAELLGAPDGSGSGATFANIVIDNVGNESVLTGTTTAISAGDFTTQTSTTTDDTLALVGAMDIPANASISIEYSVVVANSAAAGADLLNQSSISYNSNVANGGRSGADSGSDDDDNADLNNYNESASSTLTIADNLAVQSSLNPIHESNDFTVGDTVFIDIRLDVNEGQEPNASITNLLPSGLEFVAATIDAPSNISYTGTGDAIDTSNSVAIDFGTITNGADNDASNDFIVVTVEALVLEVPANVEATMLTNQVTATAAGNTVGPDSLVIDIVEPDLSASITPSEGIVTLGDIVSFSVDVSASDFATDAQDVSFDIAIPSGFTYQTGTLRGPGIVDDSTPTLLSIDIGTLAADDGVKSFIFEAKLDNDAGIGVDYDFTLENAVFSSQSGTPTNDRDYTFAASTVVRSDDASFIDAQQSLVITNDVNSDGIADPGDTLGKVVVLTNNGPRVSGVTFAEAIPSNTTYVSGSLTSTVGTIDDSAGANVDIGELLPNDVVTIEFEFVVDANTPQGTVIVAQGVVDSDATIPELTDIDATDSNGDQANQIRVGGSSSLSPALQVAQNISLSTDADSNNAVSAGDQLTVTYTLQNTGAEDLSNVSLADVIPAGLSSANNTAIISGAADSNDSIAVTANSIDVVLAELAAGEIVTVTVLVDIDAPLVNLDGVTGSEVFEMQGSVVSDQTPSLLADANNNPDDGAQASTITAVDTGGTAEPLIAVSQSYILVNDVDGDGLVDPGDTVELLTNITNSGSASATNVSASQAIPTDTTAIAGSRATSKGVITDAGAGNFDANIGSIAPGETVTTSFLVTIDSLSANTLITSQQSVSGDGFTSVASDANADLSDGASPTLINVAVSSAPEYAVATTLSGTSDSSTTANNFVQGEVLTLSFTADFPAGLTRDARMVFDLPAGFENTGVTARVKRVFDNNISAGNNPGTVNSAANDTFVNVSPSFDAANGGGNDTAFIDLGAVFATDNDADGASYVIELIVDTSSVAPTQATQAFTIASSLQYNNELDVSQSLASDDIVVSLNNRAPVAVNNAITVVEDSMFTMITPLSGDSDPDNNQTLTVTSIGTPSQGGTATLDAMQNVIYTPAENFVGTETIAYTISDGAGGTAMAIITVSVTGTNDDPVAVVDARTTDEDVQLIIDALDNDTDIDGDTLTITSASSPNGTVTINADGDLVFTPAENFNGSTTISYDISDGNGGTATGTVNVTVNPVNDDPEVPDQTVATNEDTPVTINGLLDASDPENDDLTVTAATASTGTVTVNPDGTLEFTPAEDSTDPVTITYTIEDGNGGTTTATVTVNVTPVNDPPVANPDAVTIPEEGTATVNVLANDTDPDNNPLSVSNASSNDGSVVVLPNGDVQFTPNPNFTGDAVVFYTLIDSTGEVDTGTLLVTVTPENDAPVVPDQTLAAVEDTPLTFDPLANGVDVDGDDLTISNISVTEGTITQNPDGSFTYTPDPDFSGFVVVTYTVDDGNGGTDDVTVTINVAPTMDPPVANPDTAVTPEDSSITVNVVANDSDPDGDSVFVTEGSSPDGTVVADPATGEITFTPNPDFTGPATINYSLSDGNGNQVTGVLTVDVTPVNDDPVASNQTLAVEEDTTLTIDPLINASDVDGDTLTITNLVASSGTVTQNPDGSLSFTPDPNFNGPVTITYLVDDGNGGTTPVTVHVNVQAVVDAPVANPDEATTNEDTPVTINVLVNDTDAENEALTVIQATSPDGTITIDTNGDLVFTPNPDFTGEATIDYIVQDSSGEVGISTATVTVVPVNDDPVVPGQSLSTNEDTPLTINPLVDAVDVDGDTLTVTDIVAADGTVTVNPDGSFNFVPAPDFEGNATITYNVDDGNGGVVPVVITITVIAQNDDPVAQDDSASTNEDEQVVIDVLGNDDDVDGDTLTVTNPTSSDGTVIVNADGELVFTPNPDFNGTASITYTIEDGNGGTDSATVVVTVVAVNDPPVAPGQSLSVAEDTPLLINPLLGATDVDGDTLVVSGVSASSGTVVLNSDGSISYTPAPDFNGPVTLTYLVDDGNGGVVPVTITIDVTAVNDDPVAVNDAASTDEDSSVTINVLINDSDVDGDSLTVITPSSPNGTVTVNADGNLVFTPNADFNGIATITYTISDGNGGTDTASVEVTVVPINDAPVGVEQTLSTNEDTALTFNPLDGASDVDGDTLSVSNVTASSGTVTLNPDGTITFEPAPDFNGPVTITYTIDDGNGGTTTVTSTINVQAQSDAPVANPDSGTTLEDNPVTVNVLANDSDVDGDALSVSNAASNDGEVVVLPNGDIQFTPAPDFTGVAVLTYTLIDATGAVDTGTVSITVSPVNDAPVVPDQILAGEEDSPVTFNPLENGSDVDGDELTVSDVVASSGTVVVNPDGTITFTPEPNFNGPVEITYTVDDGNGGTIEVTVVINVAAITDPPVAVPDTATTVEDTPLTIDVVANDTDPDGDTLTVIAATSPDGEVTINANGELDFTPNPDFTGVAIISYTLSDGTGQTVTGTATVDVTPVNDAPVASDQTLSTQEDTPLTFDPLINASDVDGDSLSISGVVASSGSVVINPDGTVTFTPDPNFNGPVAITYLIDDGNGGTVAVTVNINVLAVVDAPIANPDTATTNEDTPVSIDVLANDTDVENEVLRVISASSPDGDVEIGANGEVIFTPNEDFNGDAEITYVIEDESGQVASSTVTVTVLPVNDAPIAPTLTRSLVEDTELNIDVIGLSSDPDGDTISLIAVSVDVGEVSINPDGSISFTPPANYNGPAVITYTIDDGNGGTTTATITIDVTGVNDAPAIEDTAVTVEGNGPSIIDIFDLIVDPDSTDFEIVEATVTVGTITINDDGTVSFEPPFGFEGEVTAIVCVVDEAGAEVCATITITVVITNTPPIADSLSFVTPEDTSVQIEVSATDAQLDPISFTLQSMPNGELIGTAPNFTYIPPTDFVGETSFTYIASDAELDSEVATVTITVIAVNDPPVAFDDFVNMTDMMGSFTIDVLENDVDADGDALTVISAQATIGEVNIVDNQLVFTPPIGFVGVAVIEYVITDPDGETSTARVLVSVGRDDDSDFPVINVPDDIFIDATALYTKVDLGVATAVDRFGNPLPVSVIDGLILYEPGVNTVFYVAEDSEGRRSIATQLVRVNPLISIQKDQSVLEGRNMRVSVHLNGQAPVYPLVVPFEVTGTADSGDHNLISGEVVFNNVTETFIDFEGFADNIEEGIETIVITLSDTVNIGNKFEHVIDIREDNVNPEIDIIPTQNDIQTNFILNTAGLVTLESLITHPDPNNEYDFVWTNVEDVLVDIDSDDFTYTFDPSDVPVGVYQINVEITDRDDPDFNDNTVLFLQITDTIVELGNGDADLDGIPDNLEGFNDSDGDGIPDYLDAIPECNVLPEEVDSLDAFLVEGDPGVCLRIGNFALGKDTGGARLLDEELGPDEDVPTDPIATNIGGIFDFIAYGLPEKGQSYRVVLPQKRPVPENAVYRKFTEEDGWQFFDETGGNRLWSTPGEPGFCPPPGGDYWTPGLNPGHWCVQLEIVDGGPNDADDMANKNIIDPGFVGVVFAQPNALPVAEDDARETRQEVPVTIDALNNDSDPDGDELTITSVNSFFGTVSIVDNQVFYEPAFGFTGVDVVSYGITDGNGGTDVAVITITVVGSLPPIAVNDSAVVDVGESVTIDAISNDSDPDGGSISITDATVDQGEVRIIDGQIVYTAPVGFNGDVIITYTITNSEGLIAIAQIRVTVNEVLVRIRNESSGGSVGIFLIMMLLACGVYRRRRLQNGFNWLKLQQICLRQSQSKQQYTSTQGASHE
ncbi:tandem-95 repeat protein [Glaciecola sp. MH2013]|uniref:tandem-95 repeat protein n=1 Tax=Glaciecola sp. MH2013 TaxID=2785524 RepID=UPI00189EC60F|nr:tandem-95 repeat protein [Glaciecola sp. MH2013]MBF7073393.1 tandem-95 repeat protein [Glaciecola sp. MH2013]